MTHARSRKFDSHLADSPGNASRIGGGSVKIGSVETIGKEELLAHAMQLEAVLQAHDAGTTYQPRLLKAGCFTLRMDSTGS